MRIACRRCQTLYDVPDEKLERGAVKVRCSECGHLFAVRKRAGASEKPPGESAPELPTAGESPQGSLDLGGLDAPESSDQTESEPAPPEIQVPSGSLDLSQEPAAEPSPEPSAEARFEDFDFESFGGASAPAEGEPTSAPPPPLPEEDLELPGDDLSLSDEEALASLGELDLGEFEDLEDDNGLGEAEASGYLREPDEPLQRVREEELVSPRAREVQVQGLADDIQPRLDIQRGPRRGEGATPSPLVARDRRRSPLFWIVLAAAVGTAGYTGYNLYLHPEAFTFFQPSKISALWQARKMEAQLGVEDLRGYYRDLPAGRRVFIIQGEVSNRSQGPRSLIRVRGNLFGASGETVGSREVYCGNVLSETELATLPIATVEARLQNEVGQTLSNVDIAPGSRVPFMVVFPSPPEGVEKYNVTVTEARAGSGS